MTQRCQERKVMKAINCVCMKLKLHLYKNFKNVNNKLDKQAEKFGIKKMRKIIR